MLRYSCVGFIWVDETQKRQSCKLLGRNLMPKKGRVVMANYAHHVVRRGHNRRVVSPEEDGFRYYLDTLKCWKMGFSVKVNGY